jgi:hypothetical protein
LRPLTLLAIVATGTISRCVVRNRSFCGDRILVPPHHLQRGVPLLQMPQQGVGINIDPTRVEGHSTDLSVSYLDYGEEPRKVQLREILFSLFKLDCLWREDSVEVERCSSQLYCVVYLRHPCIMTRRGIKNESGVLYSTMHRSVICLRQITSEICQSLAPKMKSQSPKQWISLFNARLLTQGTRIELMSSPALLDQTTPTYT